MRKEFDLVRTLSGTGADIEYGFIAGGNIGVFIKVGLKGSLRGYDDKYLKIADKLNLLFGYSVLVASNPNSEKAALEEGYKLLKRLMEKAGIVDPQLYYMGFSNGAYLGFVEGYKYDFKKYLLINSPLVLNIHRIKRGLKQLSDKEVVIVYGQKDPSAKYSGMLEGLLNDNIQLTIVDGADHQFVGLTENRISERSLR